MHAVGSAWERHLGGRGSKLSIPRPAAYVGQLARDGWDPPAGALELEGWLLCPSEGGPLD